MIKVTVERRYGAVTVKSRVVAPSIERAMELAGKGANLVLPVEPDAFFQAPGATEGVEKVHELGREEPPGMAVRSGSPKDPDAA